MLSLRQYFGRGRWQIPAWENAVCSGPIVAFPSEIALRRPDIFLLHSTLGATAATRHLTLCVRKPTTVTCGPQRPSIVMDSPVSKQSVGDLTSNATGHLTL